MKTALDPRHQRRQHIVQLLFANSFAPQHLKDSKAKDILASTNEIDKTIEMIAPEFPIDKINRVDLAILRLAVYELTMEKKEPSKVVLDEAIELSKEFGGDSSPAFINGALGTLVKKLSDQQL